MKILEKYAEIKFIKLLTALFVWGLFYYTLSYIFQPPFLKQEDIGQSFLFSLVLQGGASALDFFKKKRGDIALHGYLTNAIERLAAFFWGIFLAFLLNFFLSLTFNAAALNPLIFISWLFTICFVAFIVPLFPEKYKLYFP